MNSPTTRSGPHAGIGAFGQPPVFRGGPYEQVSETLWTELAGWARRRRPQVYASRDFVHTATAMADPTCYSSAATVSAARMMGGFPCARALTLSAVRAIGYP